MNSVIAWTSANEFRDALTSNRLTSWLGHTDALIRLIGVNDGLLFLLILSGKLRKIAVAWGMAWVLAVIYVTGFRASDFIEHVGVLALLLYYSFI